MNRSLIAGCLLLASIIPANAQIDIGSRRELFVDGFLIEMLDGQAALKLHQPKPQEVVLTTDKTRQLAG